MTNVVKLNPDSLATPPEGKHAHITIAPPNARMAFIAGQVAIDKEANVIGAGQHYEQAVQCFKNLRDALVALDSSADQITQMTIIVVDYGDALLDQINRAGETVFGMDWPVTATTLIGATALGHSSFLVEVSAIVALTA